MDMTPEKILACPARVLSQAQREHYFEVGYVMVESLIPANVIDQLLDTTDMYLERSRSITQSDDTFDLAPGHGKDTPTVRRLNSPDLDPVYWQFATGLIADVAADLVGPDVTFHHSKLNFKWAMDKDSNAVGWHQDIPFYPHTNYNVLAIGTYLMDTFDDDGPIMIIPGSHNGPLYELYDEKRVWMGQIAAKDVKGFNAEDAVCLPGPKGSITVHNARAVHGSRSSTSPGMRPLLINNYAAADAYPYADSGNTTSNYRKLVRGIPALWADHDSRPCPIPPDWSKGYPSIYAQQELER